MQKFFVVEKCGVWAQETYGVLTEERQAVMFAERLAALDSDNYHQWTVLSLPIGHHAAILENIWGQPLSAAIIIGSARKGEKFSRKADPHEKQRVVDDPPILRILRKVIRALRGRGK